MTSAAALETGCATVAWKPVGGRLRSEAAGLIAGQLLPVTLGPALAPLTVLSMKVRLLAVMFSSDSSKHPALENACTRQLLGPSACQWEGASRHSQPAPRDMARDMNAAGCAWCRRLLEPESELLTSVVDPCWDRVALIIPRLEARVRPSGPCCSCDARLPKEDIQVYGPAHSHGGPPHSSTTAIEVPH